MQKKLIFVLIIYYFTGQELYTDPSQGEYIPCIDEPHSICSAQPAAH